MLHASSASTASAEVFLGAGESVIGPDPVALRQAAADLVAANRTGEAMALVLTGLASLPDSEDLLVMRALIGEMRHDWADAAQTLDHLARLQGERAPAQTWCHRIRVLRCLGDWRQALEIARQALAAFPDHPLLVSEWQTLRSAQACDLKAAA